jgi:hypothetical protein
VIEERVAHAIRKKYFGLLDAFGLAGETEDLQGWIVRRQQIQTSIQQQKAVIAWSNRHYILPFFQTGLSLSRLHNSERDWTRVGKRPYSKDQSYVEPNLVEFRL